MRYVLYVGDEAVVLNVDYDAVWQPSKLYGLPENCWQGESELEINKFEILENDNNVPTENIVKAINRAHKDIEDACWGDYLDARQAFFAED